MKERNREDLTQFEFDDEVWSTEPITAFYDWLYLRALSELKDKRVLERLGTFSAFSDIEFNPSRSFNCLAKSCALAVAILRADQLEVAIADMHSFLRTIDNSMQSGLEGARQGLVAKQQQFEF